MSVMTRQERSRPGWHASGLLALIVAGCLICGLWQTGHAQTPWRFSPYRVQVFLIDSPDAFSQPVAEGFMRQVQSRLRCRFGAYWEPEVNQAPSQWAGKMRRESLTLRLEDVPPEWKKPDKLDKVVLLGLNADPTGWLITAHEWDVRLEQWGPLTTTQIPGRCGLIEGVADAVFRAHVPLAEISAVENQTAYLSLRGSLLWDEPRAFLSSTSPLFLASVRYEDRDGNARAVIPLPWTVFKPAVATEAETLDPGNLKCEIVSGIRNPLAVRRRGRSRLYAWRIQTNQSYQPQLQLVSREDDHQPLVGYQVFTRDQGQATETFRFAGRTDYLGRITLPATGHDWYLVTIRHGKRLIAKVPVVASPLASQELSLPNDDARLAAEAYLKSVQDELVDLVTLRQILLARLRSRIQARDFEAANQVRDALLKMKSREIFSSELSQQRQKFYCPDPVGQKQIDAMFSEMQRLVHNYLNPAEVEQLVKLLADSQRKQAGT